MRRGRRPAHTELRFEPWLMRGASKISIIPRMSVSRRGDIWLNAAACGEIGDPRCVRIMLDRDSRAVGVMATEDGDQHGYVLRNTGKGRGRSVSGAVALRWARLLPTEPVSSEAKLAGNVLYIVMPAGALP